MTQVWQDSGLRNSLIISACLHIALLLLAYFGLPNLFRAPPPKEWKPIPFEIVEIGAITNTNIKKEPERPKEPPKPPTPKETEKPVKAEAKPSEPEKPKPVERKPDVPTEALLPKPKEKPKPPEPPKPVQPKPDQLASVLKNVAKLKTVTESKDDAKEKPTTPSEQKSLAPSLSERLTISEEDMLRRQLSQCWNMPVGARDVENLIVEVLIQVNEDRTVAKAEIVDRMRYNTDGFFRAAADAAIRALRHPNCSPLAVPPDKYEQWKTIRFFFDPRDMI